MNKRNRNLIALLSVMLLMVSCLCACMVKEKPKETENAVPSTTTGFGVDEWENDPTTATDEGSGIQQPTQESVIDDPTQTTETEITSETTAATTPTDGSQPTESTQNTTPQSPYAPGSLSYEEYMALSAEDQSLYALAFSSVEEYIKWFNTVKAESNSDDVIEITGPVNLEDYS